MTRRAARIRRLAVTAPLALLLTGAVPSAALADDTDAPSAVLHFAAEAGAFPLSDSSGHWSTPGHEIVVREYENTIKIDSGTWDGRNFTRIELSRPDGTPLGLGAHQQGQTPETIRTLVIHGGLGCVDGHAAVLIDRIDRHADGTLIALDANLEHRCSGPTGPALRAQVHYRA
jgi:hypothetical protein